MRQFYSAVLCAYLTIFHEKKQLKWFFSERIKFIAMFLLHVSWHFNVNENAATQNGRIRKLVKTISIKCSLLATRKFHSLIRTNLECMWLYFDSEISFGNLKFMSEKWTSSTNYTWLTLPKPIYEGVVLSWPINKFETWNYVSPWLMCTCDRQYDACFVFKCMKYATARQELNLFFRLFSRMWFACALIYKCSQICNWGFSCA